MKIIRGIWFIVFFFSAVSLWASDRGEEVDFNPEELIFSHLGDEYGWDIWGFHLPLPVIVRDEAGEWFCFSSARLERGASWEGFRLAVSGKYAGKIIASGQNGEEYRPLDLSVTKNVFALFICVLVLCWLLFPLRRWYRKQPYQAPRRVRGMMEAVVEMLYKEVIVSVLGKNARRFAPYLLTLFFFILVANLMGLIVVFPGGANLTGNISVTLVLAACTFVVVNFSGKKRYWKEILWPDVPLWLKFPLPMMPVIEIFGIFTKPIALMIRLFANMMGGHLITLVLISLIFIFSALGAAATAGSTVVAIGFAVFMGLIDILICFIQAYVFFMLSAIFISLALPGEESKTENKPLN